MSDAPSMGHTGAFEAHADKMLGISPAPGVSRDDYGRKIERLIREREERPLAAAEIPFNSVVTAMARLQLLDDVEIMAMPDPEWIIKGVIPRGGRVAWVGMPDSFKTTSIADLLVAIATGQPWHGHDVVHRGASIYLSAEERSGFKVRLAAAKRGRRLSLDAAIGVYTYPHSIDLREPATVAEFITFIKSQSGAFVVIVIDTFAASTPGASENSSEDMTVAMAAAQKIGTELDATIILCHHTNASGTRERGHSAMRGDVDTLVMLEYVDDVVHVRCDKQRNAERFKTITLKPIPDPEGKGMVLRLASEVMSSGTFTTMQTALLDVLREIAGRDGVTKTQWRDATKSICSERTFYKVANVLEERGAIVKIGTHYRPGAAQ